MKTIPQGTPPANTLGNLRIPPTLNSPARLAEYQPDAHAALARNADAFALDEAARQNKVLPFNRKASAPPAIIRGGGLEAA